MFSLDDEAGEQEHIIFKLSLLGDGGVGKTTIRHRYLGKEFSTSYLATLGADFAIKEVKHDDYHVRYQIWDLAGQPRFNQLRKSFYLGSQAAIVIFDITEKRSFNNIRNWINEFFGHNGKGKLPIILIGNKVDMRDENEDECISREMGESLAEDLSDELDLPVPFIETSAKTGKNIEEAFNIITDYFIKDIQKNEM